MRADIQLLAFGIFAFATLLCLVPALINKLRATIWTLNVVASALLLASFVFTMDKTTVVTISVISSLYQVALSPSTISQPFILLGGVCFLGVSLYCMHYQLHTNPQWLEKLFPFFMSLTMTSILGVLLAANAFTLLYFWEITTLGSVLVITLNAAKPGAKEAAIYYLAISEIGFAALATGFALSGSLQPGITNRLILFDSDGLMGILLFIGFATKLAVMPFHVWLPKAHMQAPAPASAMLSSIVVPLGIYGVLATYNAGAGIPLGFVVFMLVMAVVTALYAALTGLHKEDLKEALAYSTLSNSGLMVGLTALTIIFLQFDKTLEATLSLVALLALVVAHGVAKSILFIGSGNIERAVGGRDLDKIRGLINIIPKNTVFFLIGIANLAGIPFFAGFISEWLTLQAFIASKAIDLAYIRVIGASSIAVIAAVLALLTSNYVRIFGGSFLGKPSLTQGPVDEHSHELLPMCTLSLALIIFGIIPSSEFIIFKPAVTALTKGSIDTILPPVFHQTAQLAQKGAALGTNLLGGLLSKFGVDGLTLFAGNASIAPAYLLISFGIACGACIFLFMRRGVQTVNTPWLGGAELSTSDMQYKSTAYTNLFFLAFGRLFGSKKVIKHSDYVGMHDTLTVEYLKVHADPIHKNLYLPLIYIVRRFVQATASIRSGYLGVYVGYIMSTFILLLFFIVIFK